MNEKQHYLFNLFLIVSTVLIAISSILLECISGKSCGGIPFSIWIRIHIGIAICWTIVIAIHLYLHWNRISNWYKRAKRLNTKISKIVTLLWVVTTLTGLIATLLFCREAAHYPIGAIHGKFGLLLLFFCSLHLYKRFRWFKGRRRGTAFSPAVNLQKCIRCGKCVKRCPEQLFIKNGSEISVHHPYFCLQCMKCVAHCPKGAIS